MAPPTMSENEKEARVNYTNLLRNTEYAKLKYSAEEYKVIREFAERLRHDIVFNNKLDDLPELPD